MLGSSKQRVPPAGRRVFYSRDARVERDRPKEMQRLVERVDGARAELGRWGRSNSKTSGKGTALRSGTAASQAESRCSAIHERYAASRQRIFVGAKAPTYKDWDVESSATRRLPFEPV